jgi:hypothetical protein
MLRTLLGLPVVLGIRLVSYYNSDNGNDNDSANRILSMADGVTHLSFALSLRASLSSSEIFTFRLDFVILLGLMM